MAIKFVEPQAAAPGAGHMLLSAAFKDWTKQCGESDGQERACRCIWGYVVFFRKRPYTEGQL